MVSKYVSEFLEQYAPGCEPDDLWFVLFDDSDRTDIGGWCYVNYNKSNALSYTKGRPELLLVHSGDIATDAKLRFGLKGCFKFADCAGMVSLVASYRNTNHVTIPDRLMALFKHYFAVTEGDTSISILGGGVTQRSTCQVINLAR